MATVLERFNHLGLAHNNKILMIVGVHIGKRFVDPYHFHPITMTLDEDHGKRNFVLQKEGNENFEVWNYPESWTKEMDRLIINFLEHYLDVSQK